MVNKKVDITASIINSIQQEISTKKDMVPKLRPNVKFTYQLGYQEGLEKALEIIFAEIKQ